MNSEEVTSSKLNENAGSGGDVKETHEKRRKLMEEKLKSDELMIMYRERFEDPLIVVDLDRAENDGRKDKCLNVDCTSNAELVYPPEFARKYYSHPKGKNQFICTECLDVAFNFFKEAEDDLRKGKSIYEREFPAGNEVIVVDDEDEADVRTYDSLMINEDDDSKEVFNFIKGRGTSLMIKEVCKMYDYQRHKKEQIQKVNDAMDKLEEQFDSMIQSVSKGQDELFCHMRDLYDAFKPQRKDLEPFEVPYEEMRAPGKMYGRNDEGDCIFTGLITDSGPSHLPPHGVIVKPELTVGQLVFAMKVSVFSEWIPATIEEVIKKPVNGKTLNYYKVAIGGVNAKQGNATPVRCGSTYKKDISAQLLAYYQPLPVRFTFGSRVIAEFTAKAKDSVSKRYYSGMIAEIPSAINNYRYLIFFDDGRVQYVNHASIRLICEAKPHVWEHFAPKVQPFIKRYIATFPERAMLKVKNLDCVKTECRGYWVNARVVEIDCSLVHLFFLHDKHNEWLYRGSARLYPMWVGVHSKSVDPSRPTRAFAARRTTSGPYVQYENHALDEDSEKENAQRPTARAVAKKSSTQVMDADELDCTSRRLYDRRASRTSNQDQKDGCLTQVNVENVIQPRAYRPHPCSNPCVSWIRTTLQDVRGMNPLVTPLRFGFARILEGSPRYVVYVGPCGRKLNSIDEVLRYLSQTKFELSIDMFDFDSWINILNEYHVNTRYMVLKDLSFGVENIPIVCVNTLDTEVPKYMDYMTNRRATEGVDLNLDPEFLVGCDCTDNCQDKEKCACWQLTLAQGNCNSLNKMKDFQKETIGYQYKRLPNLVSTGIYECNSRCKCCVETCLNRVVQHPLKHKLQLFKTKHKGWGTRCLNDIPAGTFICVYVGNIFTEAVANEDGRLYGDEYFAELDYIEVVEASKEGYEDYVDPDPDNPDDVNRDYSDEDEYYDSINVSSPALGMSLRRREQKSIQDTSEDEEDEDDPEPMDDDDMSKNGEGDDMEGIAKQYPSVRSFYGKNESVYIMDAKHSGNIGRYLNHSCDPNIFVQNVFVDTHDLRFPWVAFFSLKYIQAGTELTWDYRYEVDSVPGKKLKCFCLAENCRGRLL